MQPSFAYSHFLLRCVSRRRERSSQCTSLCLPARLQELAEQRLIRRTELFETDRGGRRTARRVRPLDVAIDPFLSGREPLPAANRRRQVDVPPGRMTGRLAQLLRLREERLDELLR